MKFLKLVFGLLLVSVPLSAHAQKRATLTPEQKLEARILQLEDERNLNGDELPKLLKHASPVVRHRAIIALGRIGDERGVAPLLDYLEKYKDEIGRPLVIFALGEIESAKAFASLLAEMARHNHLDSESARAAEALGKIGSVAENIPLIGQAQLERASLAIIKLLPAANEKLSPSQLAAAGWCITALMRLRSPQAVAPLTQQLQSNEAALRAQAANALSRLRLPIAEAVPALLNALNDSETDVRANAARALGVAKDARAVEPLIKALSDKNQEVVVTAIRSLAQLSDGRAVEPLMQLLEPVPASSINVLLETAAALTALKAKQALPALLKARAAQLPKRWLEIESAVLKLSENPTALFPLHGGNPKQAYCKDWRRATITAQAITSTLPIVQNAFLERAILEIYEAITQANSAGCNSLSVPALTRTLTRLLLSPDQKIELDKLRASQTAPAAGLLDLFESTFTDTLLEHKDLYIRAAAASSFSAVAKADVLIQLLSSLAMSTHDGSNDAKLAILSALAKYKTEPAIAAIKTALKDRDILVRRHAVRLLKQLDAGDFSEAIGTVQTGRTAAFYQFVVAQSRQKLFATITTDKGTIKLELFPQDAPLTVNNFVTLARKGYFDRLAFHRVVPNFVIQGGDPRGTGDGGPGYAIRCEVNTRSYGRGALGMALSGKDTGGSQWFITHAPQPHLDGGYTVFGQVLTGMEVVDRITRDDAIHRIVITNK